MSIYEDAMHIHGGAIAFMSRQMEDAHSGCQAERRGNRPPRTEVFGVFIYHSGMKPGN